MRKMNQLFMDDLKLYAEGRTALARMLEATFDVSKAMGMEFGLRKCAVAHVKAGRARMGEGMRMADGGVVKHLDKEDTYRYLGVTQLFRVKLQQTRNTVAKEYLRRLRAVWSSDLSSAAKARATNVWAVAVLRYFLGLIHWSRGSTAKLGK